ncbi:MAG: conjugal transfer protein TraD [Rhabdochlamydiaceae bacterium]|nr:conjugal transfer protein TraD [Candidatus Amphrikana amoebophyrae]
MHIEKQQKEIDEKRKKLIEKEKKLKANLRKEKIRKKIQLGEIVELASIDPLSKISLLGALLEIKTLARDEEKIKQWEEKGTSYLNSKNKTDGEQLIVSFPSSQAPVELKNALKSLKFRWNSYRQEWYGISKLSDVENILKETNAKVERVNSIEQL